MSSRVALATSAEFVDLYPEERAVVPALDRVGVGAEPAVWSDPAVDWTVFDAVLIRSCWDYHERLAEFAAWIDRLEASGVRVWNPPDLVRWNWNKKYLHDLEDAGVPILETRFVPAGTAPGLEPVLAAAGWEDVVVKPAVSLSGFDTWRMRRGEAPRYEARWRDLAGKRDMLVQRYAAEVETDGEWSFVYLPDGLSHVVRKHPAPGEFRVHEEYGGSRILEQPGADDLAAADRVVAAAPGPFLYARVDGVRVGGTFRLMELELIDPALYLVLDPGLPARFARAIAKAL